MNEQKIKVYGALWCPDCRRTLRFLHDSTGLVRVDRRRRAPGGDGGRAAEKRRPGEHTDDHLPRRLLPRRAVERGAGPQAGPRYGGRPAYSRLNGGYSSCSSSQYDSTRSNQRIDALAELPQTVGVAAGEQDREPADYRRDRPGDEHEEQHDDLRDDEDEAEADGPAIPSLDHGRERRLDRIVAVAEGRVLVAEKRLVGEGAGAPAQVELLQVDEVFVRLAGEDDDEPVDDGGDSGDRPEDAGAFAAGADAVCRVRRRAASAVSPGWRGSRR